MVATSNIHPGLAAWAATHAYTVGQRVSKSSNAYQCTAAGTSGSTGPSGTGSSIADGGVTWKWLSAISYTSVSAWIAGIPSTLTQPVVGLLWNNGPITTTAGTAFWTLTGKTGSSTNTITLKCAPGESFRDKLAGGSTALNASQSNGVAFTFPAGAGGVNYTIVDCSNVILEGLQFIDTNSTSNCTQMAFGAQGNVIVRDCIFDGYAQAGGSSILGYTGAGTGITIVNSLVVDRSASGATGGVALSMFSNPMVIADCTVVAPNSPSGNGGIDNQNTTGTMTVKNTILLGYGAGLEVGSSGGGTLNIDHCLTSNASFSGTGVTTGSGNVFSKTMTNQFVSTTADYRLKSTADAKDSGVTDTTNNTVGDDIIGTTRPQGSTWDIGAFEYPATITNAVGTASGSGSASATGSANASSTSSATGSATAVATGAMWMISTASATGSSTVTATGAPTAASTAAATGSATVTATGKSNAGASATATGTGTASATGSGSARATASSSGSGTATATGAPKMSGTATASGSGTATATGSAKMISTANATGTATVIGNTSGMSQQGSGVGNGTATALAIGQYAFSSAASATGSATAQAASVITFSGTAEASGSADAQAQSDTFVRFFRPPTITLVSIPISQ